MNPINLYLNVPTFANLFLLSDELITLISVFFIIFGVYYKKVDTYFVLVHDKYSVTRLLPVEPLRYWKF